MPPKKIPIKGEPDFTNVSDERLKDYIDFVQQMIFAFEHVDEECTENLKYIWKMLSLEHTERLSEKTVNDLDNSHSSEKPVMRKIKPIKSIKSAIR